MASAVAFFMQKKGGDPIGKADRRLRKYFVRLKIFCSSSLKKVCIFKNKCNENLQHFS